MPDVRITDEQRRTLLDIRAFVHKRDRPPLAEDIGAKGTRHWPANKERARALKDLIKAGLVKRSESGLCWLTDAGSAQIGVSKG